MCLRINQRERQGIVILDLNGPLIYGCFPDRATKRYVQREDEAERPVGDAGRSGIGSTIRGQMTRCRHSSGVVKVRQIQSKRAA